MPNADSVSSALCRTLSQANATNPFTKNEYSEAMLFGLSGGLGLGYILWEFKKDNSAPLVLGLTRRWNYPMERLTAATDRVGLSIKLLETASAKKADQQLAEACATDPLSPLIGVDWFHCPFGWVMTAQQDKQGWLVQDIGTKPVPVSADIVAKARNAYPTLKHRLIRFDGYKAPTKKAFKANCQAALLDMSDYLNSGSDSFGLPALKKWQRLLTDNTKAKGWPVVFKGGRNLAPALATIYQRIVLTGTDGRALRGLYAQFLREVAPIVKLPALDNVATLYDQAGLAWRKLGQAALQNDDPLRRALDDRARAHGRGGIRGQQILEEADEIVQQALRQADYTADPDLFSHLSDLVGQVYDKETQALFALDTALNRR